jgi:hypothetical protein
MMMKAPADPALACPGEEIGGILFFAPLRAISIIAEAPHRNKE